MSEKIRVLNIISDTNIGGAGHALINFLRCYDRERFAVTVVLPRGSRLVPEIQALNTPFIEVDGIADKSLDLTSIRVLRKIIRREKPQIVHTHGALSGRIAGRQAGCKVIYTRHCAFPIPDKLRRGPGRLVNKWVTEHYSDRIIAISPAAAENLTDVGIDEGRIDVMMNGVDPIRRKSPEECDALRKQWQLSPGIFTVGILARLEPYKGHRYILEAAAALKKEGRAIQVLIAGAGSSEGELKALTKSLDLEHEVHFLGFVTDVSSVLSLLDVQLNASYVTETSSLSILEGFSIGVPAVVSNFSGNPYLVDDGEDGLLFPNRDSAGLTACLARLMDERETLTKMGRRAREIYEARFTGEIFARNIEAVYLRTLEGDRHE